jgi:hypothetical protein
MTDKGKQASAKSCTNGLELLAVAIIVMKLAGVGVVASWPWYVVLAPIWGPLLAIVLFVFAAYLVKRFG